jgi:hypothetical protein
MLIALFVVRRHTLARMIVGGRDLKIYSHFNKKKITRITDQLGLGIMQV